MLRPLGKTRVRLAIVAAILLLLLGELIPYLQPTAATRAYALGSNMSVLPDASAPLASRLKFNPQTDSYDFNAGYNPLVKGQATSGGPLITANAASLASKGVTVTDPVNNISLVVKPQAGLKPAQQQQNRIIYPFNDGTGWLVYTMEAGQVKEDVLLSHANGDKMTLKYQLDFSDSLSAKLEKNGAIAVYGNTLLSGNVSTGSAKDAALLVKARRNAPKTTLLFMIPPPVVNEYNTTRSSVRARYELAGNLLTLRVSGLKKAHYPLTIDPSVYVTTAQQFMQGNNESNIDYDTTNDLIQKGKLTGASVTGWNTDLALNASRWAAGYAAGGGYAYVTGGLSGGTAQNSVYWAQFNPTANTMNTPPNPGTGAAGCNSTNWCTNAAYNLPNNRSGQSSVVYNGYLYVIGGTGADAACLGGNNVCTSTYVAKLGANGEPISWTTTSSLATGRRFAGAVAYKDRLYIAGGQTTGTLNGVTSIETAAINPDGTLGSWSTTGMTAMTTALWGESVVQYNGYLYVIGGASTTTAQTAVSYIKINSDGTLAGSWVATTAFNNARMAFGGNFATVYGGYLYITTGCATLTTASCSSFTSPQYNSVTITGLGTTYTKTDFQFASINADGSLTGFTVSTMNSVSTPTVSGTPLTSAASTAMTGYGLLAWRGALYGIGGCTAVSTATNCSGTTQTQVTYAPVNTDGNTSTIYGSSSSDFYNNTNYLYDLPTAGTGAGQGGRMASGVVINNGYIYNIGGCSVLACTTMTRNTEYAAINSDGTLAAPGTCGGTIANTIWCVDNTHQLPTAGIGAFGITVNNNVIYVVGGFIGSGNTQRVSHTTTNADGSINAWTNDGNTAASASAGYIFAFARAAPNSGTQSYLYMIGGCTGSTGIGCSGYVSTVMRCTIPNGGGALSGCVTTATTPQLQLFTGTGIFGGAVYGDYIYLAGGANSLSGGSTSPTGATCTADPNACGGQMDIVQYAQINTSGNIVRADNGATTGGWQIASSRLAEERRRTTAFAINGYLYVVAGHNGNAPAHTLHDIDRGKINVNTGDVTDFTKLTTTITDRWDLRAAQANGYIYLLGGCTNGAPPSSCTNTGGTGMSGVGEYVQVYNNWSASPAAYTSSTNRFTTDRLGAGATILNGYLYVAGGCTSTTDCSNSTSGTTTNDVSFAPLNADGSIGGWTTATNPLTTNGVTAAPRAFGRLETVGGTLYYIGGQANNAVAVNTVLYSTPNAGTGQPAAWATASNVLPAARSQLNTTVYNGHIYAVGGFSGTNATPTTTVYYSPDLSAGGDISSAWTTNTTAYQTARSGATAIAYGNNLYVLGGYDGTNYLLDVQYAPINANGSVGSWGFAASLPQVIRQGDGFATNGFLYVFGGRSAATTCTNNTYDVPINADGSLGVWSQTSVAYNTARYGVAAAYGGGRAYLLGGGCGSTISYTGNDRAVYGTLQLEPQIANYSIMINTDTNVFPSKYLVNGLDNGIGASWYLNYQSSTTANNSWGVNTNVGKLTLGTPGSYTPLDGSGANTNLTVGAQYYDLFLTIDDQNAFGFPEDVTRGPNIYDLTLQFSADPSKRLRNGKTFVNGVEQPLDTPF